MRIRAYTIDYTTLSEILDMRENWLFLADPWFRFFFRLDQIDLLGEAFRENRLVL